MPDLVVSNEGERELLALALKKTGIDSRGWRVNLYRNDFYPLANSTLANFTSANFPGYASLDIDDSIWIDPYTVTGVAYTQYGVEPLTWFPTSDVGQIIYGYYVTFDGDTQLLFSQRFTTPVTPTTLLPVTLLLLFNGRSRYAP